jgi:hypothetical protein
MVGSAALASWPGGLGEALLPDSNGLESWNNGHLMYLGADLGLKVNALFVPATFITPNIRF